MAFPRLRALLARPSAPRWLVGLATALYAFDDAHGAPVAWIANRNALMSASFGVLALTAHDRWRRQERAGFAWIASGQFLLALLSLEGGIATAGYLAAYA